MNPDYPDGLIEYLLSLPGLKGNQEILNLRMRGRTFKWRMLYGAMRLLRRLGSKNGLVRLVAGTPGTTPLHSAAFFSNVSAVRALVAAGADRSLRNADGRTPLEYAEYYNGDPGPLVRDILDPK